MAKKRRRRRRRNVLAKVSLQELQAEMLRRKREQIKELRQQRTGLRQAVAATDKQIVALSKETGTAPKGAPKVKKARRARRMTRTAMRGLQGKISSALAENKEGMAIGELCKAVRATAPRVRLALAHLINDKKVGKKGNRRSTRYFALKK